MSFHKPLISWNTRIRQKITLGAHDFELCEGLNENTTAQIVAFANDTQDTALREGTNDAVRFRDREAVRKWYSQKRYVFTLNQGDTVAGIAWFGQKNLPHCIKVFDDDFDNSLDWDTIAFRMYGKYRGAHLLQPFATECLRIYKERSATKNLWLGVHANNDRARIAYGKLGFRNVAEEPSNRRFIMKLKKERYETE